MTAKTDRLVKDLAALFVKYSLSDWQPLLSEMRLTGEPNSQLVAAIEAHLARGMKAKKPMRRVRRKTPASKGRSTKPVGKELDRSLEPLRTALLNREILATSQELKSAAASIGIKDPIPSERRDAVKAILEHLRALPEDAMRSSLSKLKSTAYSSKPDHSSEFERWVTLIMRPRNGS
jgi:hypothetical protein